MAITTDENIWERPFETRRIGILEEYGNFVARRPLFGTRDQVFHAIRYPSELKLIPESLDIIYIEELKSRSIYWQVDRYIVANPEEKDQLEFLGLDVADRGFLSGLYNCGQRFDVYGWQDDSDLPPKPLLEIADACKLVRDCNRKVRAHAPFSIYRLFRLNGWQKEFEAMTHSTVQ